MGQNILVKVRKLLISSQRTEYMIKNERDTKEHQYVQKYLSASTLRTSNVLARLGTKLSQER